MPNRLSRRREDTDSGRKQALVGLRKVSLRRPLRQAFGKWAKRLWRASGWPRRGVRGKADPTLAVLLQAARISRLQRQRDHLARLVEQMEREVEEGIMEAGNRAMKRLLGELKSRRKKVERELCRRYLCGIRFLCGHRWFCNPRRVYCPSSQLFR